MRTPIRRRLLVGLTTLALLVTAPGVASAAPADAPAPDTAAAVQLTPAQATQLQQQVEQVLRTTSGGRQVSRNQVEWDDMRVTLPLPGERIARGPDETVTIFGDPCPYQYTCLYEYEGFGGARTEFFTCGFVNLWNRGWSDRASSYHNNQTPGTQTGLYDYKGSGDPYNIANFVRVYVEPGAPSQGPSLGGADNRVDGVQVCRA